MPGERQDYLLRLIEQLRQFVAQALALRQAGKLDEALIALVHAQEKLFVRPAAEFRHLPLDEQLPMLKLGESAETGRNKCIAYAAILEQAGLVYQGKNQDAIAGSAFQLALHVLLLVASEPGAVTPELRSEIARLRERVNVEELNAPTRELLARFQELNEA
ncbi:MAG TPA: hypothetical protein VMC06_08890 [Opitutaceae bacterium]|nr:hypothetical protein [Opitutaceae bacterium]